jgi:hypothetical protein
MAAGSRAAADSGLGRWTGFSHAHGTFTMKSILLSLVVSSLALVRVASAQDMALSLLLLPGEEWKLAFAGVSFADGPTADAEGNF